MRGANEFDRERSDSDDVARLDAVQQHIAQNSVLVELAFRETEREVRSINGNVELFQDVRQRAQMIFVSVREDDGSYVVAILFKNFEVWNANVDTIDALFGKTHAGIENEHLVAGAQQGAIHAKLTDTAEGNDFEDVRHLKPLIGV